jgi:hypothetical protein
VDEVRVVRVEQLQVLRAVDLEGVSGTISEEVNSNREVFRPHVEDGVVDEGLGDLMLGEGVVDGSCEMDSGTTCLCFFVVHCSRLKGNISRQTLTAR